MMRACGAPVPPAMVGHQWVASGWSRRRGCPGETRSPSSTSHSTTEPPCGASDVDAVAQAGDRADRGTGRQHVALGGLGGQVERALGGGDDHPPRRRGLDHRRLAVLVAELAGVVELVGRLEREGLDALQRALRDAGERAGGRHLQDAGDAEVAHGLAGRGPSGPGWRSARPCGAARRGRRGRPGRRGWRSPACAGRGWRPTGPARRGDRRRAAMWTVWNAPATLSGIRRALAGGSSAKAASCSVVPAATTWPGPLSLAAVRPWRSMTARTSSRSPPRTAVIPVAVVAAASAIALPRSRTSTIACSAVITRAPAAAVELADAVAGDRADARERVGRVREEVERRDQTGRDQQRLGDLGVADRVGVCLGAVVGEVDAGHGGQPVEARGEGRVLQPGREETGGLGPLTGGDDDEHTSTLPGRDRSARGPAPTNLTPRSL